VCTVAGHTVVSARERIQHKRLDATMIVTTTRGSLHLSHSTHNTSTVSGRKMSNKFLIHFVAVISPIRNLSFYESIYVYTRRTHAHATWKRGSEDVRHMREDA